jgi:hypothetical protein
MPRSEAEVRFSVRAMNVFAKVILALLYICDHRMRFFFAPSVFTKDSIFKSCRISALFLCVYLRSSACVLFSTKSPGD